MNILKILKKDSKIAFRDLLIIYIIVIPLIMAAAIRLFSPGISDSTVKIAMLESESRETIEYMEEIAQVELFENKDDLEKRVLKRDDVPALILKDGKTQIITEGNEDYQTIESVKTVAALYEVGSVPEDTTAKIYDFGKTVPQVRTMLTNVLIQLIIMLAGMIIALSVVDEKISNTISAVRVSSVTLTQFILGKCALGSISAFLSIFICLMILGYTKISFLQLFLIALCTMVLASAVGLLQGVISSDIIEAAAGVKLVMIPLVAAVLVYQLCSDKWQWTMWWNPFYWSYKAGDKVLSGIAGWGEVILWSGLVLVLSVLVCFLFHKKIDEGLKKAS